QVGGVDNPGAGAGGIQAGGAAAAGGGDGLQLGNTIVAGNTAPNYPDVARTPIRLGHNPIGDRTRATRVPPRDLGGPPPALSDLGDHGGPTQTYVLLPDSPALNAGDNSLVDSATDQRGYARVVNGTVDIGAVEMQPGEIPGL